MEILENKAAWSAAYRAGWLAHLQETGQTNFSLYQHPTNSDVPGAPGVDLSRSRLLFISTAGGYLPGEQAPFAAANLTGDYTLRRIPSTTPLADLAYAHDHYDHRHIEGDPQVALPLRHLEEMVAQGVIGSLNSSILSFMGYQPDAARVVDELIPRVLEITRQEQPQAALLAPV